MPRPRLLLREGYSLDELREERRRQQQRQQQQQPQQTPSQQPKQSGSTSTTQGGTTAVGTQKQTTTTTTTTSTTTQAKGATTSKTPSSKLVETIKAMESGEYIPPTPTQRYAEAKQKAGKTAGSKGTTAVGTSKKTKKTSRKEREQKELVEALKQLSELLKRASSLISEVESLISQLPSNIRSKYGSRLAELRKRREKLAELMGRARSAVTAKQLLSQAESLAQGLESLKSEVKRALEEAKKEEEKRLKELKSQINSLLTEVGGLISSIESMIAKSEGAKAYASELSKIKEKLKLLDPKRVSSATEAQGVIKSLQGIKVELERLKSNVQKAVSIGGRVAQEQYQKISEAIHELEAIKSEIQDALAKLNVIAGGMRRETYEALKNQLMAYLNVINTYLPQLKQQKPPGPKLTHPGILDEIRDVVRNVRSITKLIDKAYQDVRNKLASMMEAGKAPVAGQLAGVPFAAKKQLEELEKKYQEYLKQVKEGKVPEPDFNTLARWGLSDALNWVTLQPAFDQAVQFGYKLVEEAGKEKNPILASLKQAVGYAIVGGTRAGQTATYAALTALTGGAYMVPLLASVADDISYTLSSDIERKQFIDAMKQITKDPELRNLFITELAGAIAAGAIAGWATGKMINRLKPRLKLTISKALEKLGQKTGRSSFTKLANKLRVSADKDLLSLYKGGTVPEASGIVGAVDERGNVVLGYIERGAIKYLGKMDKETFRNIIIKLRKAFQTPDDRLALERFSTFIKNARLNEEEAKALLDYIGLKAPPEDIPKLFKILSTGSKATRELIMDAIKEGKPVVFSKANVVVLKPSGTVSGLYEVELSSITEPSKTLKVPVFIRDGKVIVGSNFRPNEWSQVSKLLVEALRRSGINVKEIIQGSVHEALREAGHVTSVKVPPFAPENVEVVPSGAGSYTYVGVDRGKFVEVLKYAVSGVPEEEAYSELLSVIAKKKPITGRLGTATYELRWVGAVRGVKSKELLDLLKQFISESSKKLLTPQEFKELVDKYGKAVANLVAHNPELASEGQQVVSFLKQLTQVAKGGKEVIIPVLEQSGTSLSLGVLTLSGVKTATAVGTKQEQKPEQVQTPETKTKVSALPKEVNKVVTKLQEKGVTKVTSATDITQTLGVSETQAKEIFNKLKSSLKTVTVTVKAPKPEYITNEVTIPMTVERYVPITKNMPLGLVEVPVTVYKPQYITKDVITPVEVEKQVALTKNVPLSLVKIPVEILKPEIVTREVIVPAEIENKVAQVVNGVVVPVTIQVQVPVETYDVVVVPVEEPDKVPAKVPKEKPGPLIPPPIPSYSGTQIRRFRPPPKRGKQLEEVRL